MVTVEKDPANVELITCVPATSSAVLPAHVLAVQRLIPPVVWKLFAAVSVNANTAAWIQWYAGSTVAPNDAIALLTQTTFALNASQMSALFALAATLPA